MTIDRLWPWMFGTVCVCVVLLCFGVEGAWALVCKVIVLAIFIVILGATCVEACK